MATRGDPAPTGAPAARPAVHKLNIQTLRHGRITWVNVERPTKDEMEWLAQNYSFHPLHLDDCLSKIQRPKIDDHEDYLFIVLHFPVYNRIAQVTVASEVDIFVGPDYFVTVHAGELKPVRRMFQECMSNPARRQALMGRGTGYLLYQLADRLVDYCFPILNKIDDNIEAVEDTIFEEDVRQTVRDISVIRRDVINFRRIIKPQIAVIASLEHKQKAFLQEDLEAYFGDLADHVAKIWDILEDYKEVIEGLADTNDSLTSSRINEVMKILTTISVIMLPLTLVSGIYGMNIDLPFQDHPFSFGVVAGIMILIAVGMLTYFRRRGWV